MVQELISVLRETGYLRFNTQATKHIALLAVAGRSAVHKGLSDFPCDSLETRE